MNASKKNHSKLPERCFRDSWRPEDKAQESAEEEELAREYPDEILHQQAVRHVSTPPLRGFEREPPEENAEPGA